jgi:hypothetical protein
MPAVSILNIADNGDGTYNWIFSEPVTLTSEANPELVFVQASTENEFTGAMNPVSQISAATIQYQNGLNAPGDDTAWILAQPIELISVSGRPFQILQPGKAIA